jgi:methyltransferase (TIGR00027 family)
VASVSKTAGFVALYRALETVERRRRPLFRDPFAQVFLPPLMATLVSGARRSRHIHRWISRYADYRAPGARTAAIARTRFIDDVVRSCLKSGTSQVVVLGAGFDCRAHRLKELRAVKVFEVDREPTQEVKRAELERLGTKASHVHYVAMDLLQHTLAERLTAAGWDAHRGTLFVWEGVTNYLDEAAVAAVFSFVATSAPGSTVLFTYVHGGLLDGTVRFEGGDTILKNVRRLGEPWTFGLKPPQVGPYLSRFGLTLTQDLGADDFRFRYLEPSPDNRRGYSFYRVAVASR